jgi:type I restriction enzyme R subunit
LDHVVVAKLRMNRSLTEQDLVELERLLGESGAASPGALRQAAEQAQGLGLFVRSLVGMDRTAAKSVLAGFTARKALTANQLEFVNLIVDHLTEHGVIEPSRLYESPVTDLTPRGPDDLFAGADLDELLRALDAVRGTAVAA